MRTTSRFSLVLAVGLALAGHVCGTEDPLTTGRVLILENERTLEGDIRREGDHYRLKRAIGETWVPADKVLCLCATHAEAYRALRARANLDDADERLRLARWCQRYNLPAEALDEATHAVRLRPNHLDSQRLLNHLRRPTAETTEAPAIQEPGEADAVPAVPLELSTESISQFVTKVQPILMNACASCHAAGREGTFKLARAVGNTTAARQNLAAVLAQLNLDQPEASPLLTSALNIHGEATQPPLKGRQVAAFHTLEGWVRLIVAKNPRLREQTGGVVAAEVSKEAPQTEARPTGWAAESKAKPAARPADPFDPAAFNRQMHPQPKP